MIQQQHDIFTREDVELLISSFYNKVRHDERLAPHFANVDWAHHTPVITDFWCLILLGEQSYKGNPLSKHLHLELKNDDFERWLSLFKMTIDEHFHGGKATEAKERADAIASVFRFKMSIFR
ncbi:group III truncated hemoglobin [Pseudochryseolinea flava]|uniref:Sec-independent protein translocase TatC n=1 Tax=Pseudochryseolinea flava TaxID=2059302 RepID=A0A364Y679_9BACT|nr:group III truncated hemoglobin [Pseudochryseolinea flava]RAW02379.1 sec-independent protein translocase TatC [Pseudochryseolinea flava]